MIQHGSILRILAGTALACTLAGAACAETQELVILHDNDIHGHLRPFCYVEVGKGGEEHCDIGGAAKRATLIRSLKDRAGAPVLLIDSGDTTTRGPLATEYEGVDEVQAMNAMGYDMAAIGNNEFKLKDAADAHDAAGAQASLARLVRLADFPWLCANATDASGALLPGVQPYVVRKVGGVRIAFLGLTTGRSKSYPQVKGWVITDPVEAAKVWIPRARAEADVVIAVTHVGTLDDARLVHETRGIDAVVGGDSHTFLYKPMLEKNLDGVVVPIVQDGEFGVNLGEFRLTFAGDAKSGWKLADYEDRLVPVDGNVEPDPAITALVENYAQPLDVPVGWMDTIGDTPAERTRLTALALAAAWKSAAKASVGLEPEGAQFESFRTRTVTRYVVRAVLPFHDTVWRGQITGARLKALLDKPTPGGVMRATISADTIDLNATYTIATTAFVGQAIGGGVDTGLDARQAAEEWLAVKH
ncbi:MAG TPA: bifunctional UDP-sugar hydrolase/5'-nucleotidase [Caulobacteraceae bacterium]|jgi:5'-nucleotidase|nr:bifunctional UDP-sugar hydrolase/5'-nucleotidase [Caulobacteraceae bacterium]